MRGGSAGEDNMVATWGTEDEGVYLFGNSLLVLVVLLVCYVDQFVLPTVHCYQRYTKQRMGTNNGNKLQRLG